MGFLIQLCQHSSDTTDLFLPRNSISMIELICFLTLNDFPNRWPLSYLNLTKNT